MTYDFTSYLSPNHVPGSIEDWIMVFLDGSPQWSSWMDPPPGLPLPPVVLNGLSCLAGKEEEEEEEEEEEDAGIVEGIRLDLAVGNPMNPPLFDLFSGPQPPQHLLCHLMRNSRDSLVHPARHYPPIIALLSLEGIPTPNTTQTNLYVLSYP